MIISHENKIAEPFSGKHPRRLFVMDLDGTLLCSDRTFDAVDLHALKQLGDQGVARAIATGRSMYSFNTVADSNLPVDFVIFFHRRRGRSISRWLDYSKSKPRTA